MDNSNDQVVTVFSNKQSKLFKKNIIRPSRHKNRHVHVPRLAIILCVAIVAVTGVLIWKKSIVRRPIPKKSVTATFESASASVQAGQYNVAEKELEDYINSSATSQDKFDAQLALARVYVYKKEYSQAIELLTKLDNSGKDIGYTSYTTLVGLYEKQGNKTQAKVYLEKAIKSIKDSVEPTDDLYLPQYETKLKELSV